MTSKAHEVDKKGKYELGSSTDKIKWRSIFEKALNLVQANVPIVLFGPPGTGKTKMVMDIKKRLEDTGKLGNFEMVQFHKKFSYEDFIEGYVPAKDVFFKQRDGIFKEFCKSAMENRVNLFAIDEMNRAELTITLGETLFLIEDRDKRVAYTAHFHDRFTIPTTISIVGTMNTADRNIAKIDYALRRRFNFLPVFPDADELRISLNSTGFTCKAFSIDDYVTFFQKTNRRITRHQLMGHHMQLGHTMFIPRIPKGPITPEHLVDNLEQVILPQVEAYCGYGNENELDYIFNPLIREKYLSLVSITTDDLSALVNEVKNEN